jgi:AcrR family transcriptional regulator
MAVREGGRVTTQSNGMPTARFGEKRHQLLLNENTDMSIQFCYRQGYHATDMGDACSAAGIAGPDIDSHFTSTARMFPTRPSRRDGQRLGKAREIVKYSARAEERRPGQIRNFLRALSNGPTWAGLLLDGRRHLPIDVCTRRAHPSATHGGVGRCV